MQKIVINTRVGGFDLSEVAIQEYFKHKNWNLVKVQDEFMPDRIHYYKDKECEENYFSVLWIERTDPILVSIVEEFGDKCNTRYSNLKVVEIPDEVEWNIIGDAGIEWIAENHRIWS